MEAIKYSSLKKEADNYWKWNKKTPAPKISYLVAKEGAGSEGRTPLMHYGTVMPVYLSVIRYLKKMKIKKRAKLIELGCGSGRVLSYIKTVFPELDVYGVDYSASAIRYAQENYGNLVRFKHSTAQKTHFPDKTFDFVISSHVIEHIPKKDSKKFMKEVYRLLKKNGYGFIGTPERAHCQDVYMKNPSENPRYRLIPPHEHEYYFTDLRQLAENVFERKKMRIDLLKNQVFYTIFCSSIENFKPKKTVKSGITNFLYKIIRDFFPKNIFDKVTGAGVWLNMRFKGMSYYDILKDNIIVPGNGKRASDNLLLVCQK